ncbi:hypothetical protein B5G38_11985 [Gemmiger sp. An87]|nr:hypothetical protein B5G38_11985 [Gemmiger sp. An87]
MVVKGLSLRSSGGLIIEGFSGFFKTKPPAFFITDCMVVHSSLFSVETKQGKKQKVKLLLPWVRLCPGMLLCRVFVGQ